MNRYSYIGIGFGDGPFVGTRQEWEAMLVSLTKACPEYKGTRLDWGYKLDHVAAIYPDGTIETVGELVRWPASYEAAGPLHPLINPLTENVTAWMTWEAVEKWAEENVSPADRVEWLTKAAQAWNDNDAATLGKMVIGC